MLQYMGSQRVGHYLDTEQHKSCFQLLGGGTLISKVILSKQIRPEGPGQAHQENTGHPANFESQINNKSVCPKQYLTHLHVCSVAQLCPILCNSMDYTHQVPLSMKFSRQEYWNRLLFLSPEGLPNPAIEPTSLACTAWQVYSLPLCPLGSPLTYSDTKNVFILLS